MLLYAEHPGNHDVVVLQSIIDVWNSKSPFARAVYDWLPIWRYPFAKLANRLDTVLSVGHNCLHRMSALKEIGGFSTEFIAEDYATIVKLMQRGYHSRLVPVQSYKAAPMSIRSYTKRNIRWGQADAGVARDWDMSGIPLTTQLHIFMNAYAFAIWLVYLPGMILSLFGAHTTFSDVANVLGWMSSGQLVGRPGIWAYVMLLSLYFYFLFSRLPLAFLTGVTLIDYFHSLLLYIAMSAYMIIPQVIQQLAVLLHRGKPVFTVTDKSASSVSLRQILTDNGMSGLFIVLLVGAGVLYNPLTIVWNFPWILPILLSPAILYRAHRGAPGGVRRSLE